MQPPSSGLPPPQSFARKEFPCRQELSGPPACASSPAALGIFLFVRFLLPVLLPFLIGLALALLAQRPIAFCTLPSACCRVRWPPFSACCSCFAVLGSRACSSARTDHLPRAERLPARAALSACLAFRAAHLAQAPALRARRPPPGPDSAPDFAPVWISFFQSSGAFGAKAYEWFFQQASGFLSRLPGDVLFTVAAIVSSFMLAAAAAAASPHPCRTSAAANLRQIFICRT